MRFLPPHQLALTLALAADLADPHRDIELGRLEALSRPQRTIRLQRVHPNIAVLGVGDVNEHTCDNGRARNEGQKDRNDRRFQVSLLPGRSHCGLTTMACRHNFQAIRAVFRHKMATAALMPTIASLGEE